MRWVWKPVLIACICLAAFFGGVAVVRGENDVFLVIDPKPNLPEPDWVGQEPPSPDPPTTESEFVFSIVGSGMKWKGVLYAKCSLIPRTGGGAPLNNARLKYSCNNGPYTQFTQDPSWGLICEVPKNGFTVNLKLAPFLVTTDPPGSYTGTITFEYRAQNNNSIVTLPPLSISIEIIGAGQVAITPDPVNLVNPGFPNLEIRGQAQVQVNSIFDWDLEICCAEEFSSGTEIISPNQIQVSIDQINWKPLTADPEWTFVRSGTREATFTLYFKIDSFLPFEMGLYIGEIALRAVAGPSP